MFGHVKNAWCNVVRCLHMLPILYYYFVATPHCNMRALKEIPNSLLPSAIRPKKDTACLTFSLRGKAGESYDSMFLNGNELEWKAH